MGKLLLGAPVAEAISAGLLPRVSALSAKGATPKLAIVRFGEQAGDLAYERGIVKTFAPLGILVETVVLSPDADDGALHSALVRLGTDESVHGILPMRPFPKWIVDAAARAAIPPEKDADGVTDRSLAGLFTNSRVGYAPCTAEACMALLEHERIPLEGVRAVVVGRSLVIGKPVSMLLLNKNATVTIAHSRTKDLPAVTKEADVLIVAAGQRGLVGAEHVRAGQIVLDVGMHFDERGKLSGDVRTEEVEPIVAAVTPAKGGVGSVTTAVLAGHVVTAAERLAAK